MVIVTCLNVACFLRHIADDPSNFARFINDGTNIRAHSSRSRTESRLARIKDAKCDRWTSKTVSGGLRLWISQAISYIVILFLASLAVFGDLNSCWDQKGETIRFDKVFSDYPRQWRWFAVRCVGKRLRTGVNICWALCWMVSFGLVALPENPAKEYSEHSWWEEPNEQKNNSALTPNHI